MHTVFLVEDEPLIRQNIRNAIAKSDEPYTCIGEAGDGELALSIIQDLKPDILITDIKMPFMTGSPSRTTPRPSAPGSGSSS
jgi:two-component system response regulator YesN